MSAVARKLVLGNWKMHGVSAQLDELRRLDAALRAEAPAARVAVCPPATLIHRASEIAAGGPLEIGAQDAHAETCGARTGDLNAEMLHDAGARLVLVGHSERRAGHRESSDLVAAKVEAALRAGLEPVVCVGESLADRSDGRAEAVVCAQVEASLPLSLRGLRFAVGYEPVWAVGTGHTPSDEEIAAMHAAIRRTVAARLGPTPDGAAPVLYGGSVTVGNAKRILALPGVCGALVGGASLTAAAFLPIVRAA